MSEALITQSDGFALAMLGILVMSFGIVALLIVGIYRNGRRRESEVEQLIEELRRNEEAEKAARHRPAPPTGEETPREAWEKEADWWRK
jgi:hypothetical protein